MLAVFVAAAFLTPSNPIEFGMRELRKELHAAHLDDMADKVRFKLTKRGAKESYRITGATIEAPDQVGAMYGAYELAERVHAQGKKAFGPAPISGSPYLQERGFNLFLTLPWDYVNSRTDPDPASLTDPNRWWFHNESYWTTLLDEMARDRLNWLDIHGMWDIDVTDAPNLYPYFIQSSIYPGIGVDPAIKAANLAQLNHVIDMAHARGIHVSVIVYQTQIKDPHNQNPPYTETDTLAYDYTLEVVEKMVRQAPALDALGFRVGESGRAAAFFNCYLEGVANSGRQIPLITRSWLTSKDQLVPLARQYPDMSIELKYNGEHWGPPYIIAGGRVANWYSYSYEGYLQDSGTDPWAHTWPGHPTPEGSTWPAEPYKVVWQLRTNGTHRIFPYYHPDWVRRCVRTMNIGTATGFTLEAFNCYYPDSPRYYLRNLSDKYTDWVIDRDQVYWMLWGRLGYDPDTSDAVFLQRLQELFGDAAEPLARAWKAGSEIIARAYTVYSLGADSRTHAPEFEAGGDRDLFSLNEPFDTHSFISPGQYAAIASAGGTDGRDPTGYARLRQLALEAEQALAEVEALAPGSPQPLRLKELITSIKMQAHWGHYYAGRLEDAFRWSQWTGHYNVPMDSTDPLEEAKTAWAQLSNSPEALYYKPFTERLRMQTNFFHWSGQLAGVKGLANSIRSPWAPVYAPIHRDPPSSAVLSWHEDAGTVVCTIPATDINQAWLLEKPTTSSTYFHRMPMSLQGNQFVATFTRRNWGHLIAADVAFTEMAGDRGYNRITRIPSAEVGEPYLTVPPKKVPTPVIFSPLGALWFLNPNIITPQRYSMMLIGTGAIGFFEYAGLSDQRKVLGPVSQGMNLVIMEQNFARFRLDFLPVPLQWQTANLSTFDPGGALGLPAVQAASIIKQQFLPTSGWQVYGNGGIAHYAYGAGHIWVISARLVSKLYNPSAAQCLASLFQLRASNLPVLYVDGGEDYPDNGSSFMPDLMNSLDVPFRSLSEAVADPNY